MTSLFAPPIRVLIVDDNLIVRNGIRALLMTTNDIQVVGEANDGVEAITMALNLNPDVVLMDLTLPIMDGIETTRQLRMQWPEMRILVLAGCASDEQISPAIKAGALGYLPKDTPPETLIEAIRCVYDCDPSQQPVIAKKLLAEISSPSHKIIPNS